MTDAAAVLAELEALAAEAVGVVEAAADAEAVEAARVRFLGRKAALTGILRGLKDLDGEARISVGREANLAKKRIEEALAARTAALAPRAARPDEDPTLPGVRPPLGHEHLITATTNHLLDIFRGMGFAVARGPEVEDEFHNFEALNIPADHPARDMHDTFFCDGGLLLRTHTSPVQIRVMKSTPPPIRMVFPGRVYRNETIDATHAAEFHQLEVLYVDEGVTMRDLRGALTYFVRQVFGEELDVRFRPSYFPFVEPGAEVDISCFQCRGAGCRLCKNSGWIEILGCGMVHPQVFRAVGYDPEKVTGYAAGMGIERIAMLRHGIPDIRLFLENDHRFLQQF